MRLRMVAYLMPLLLAAAPASPAEPPFVRALDRAPRATSSPVDSADAWRLAFVDVETTGLVPGWHEMIDIGIVMTDLDGVPRDSLWVRIMPRHLDRLSPGAARVNGFDAKLWRETGAVSSRIAAERIFGWHGEAAGSRSVLMVAFNSPFDTAFLDHLLRESGRSWRELFHYFVLDLPSMAWSLGHRDLTGSTLAERLGVDDEPHGGAVHTGLTGASLNARIYRALRSAGASAMEATPRHPAGE